MEWAEACLHRTGMNGLCFREIQKHQAWALKKRVRAQQKILFSRESCKIGRGGNVFGLHRRERIAVLAELGRPPQFSPDLNRTGGPSLCKGLNI